MLVPDASQRMQALDPVASLIVQAPAGSGKTTLLAQRYLGLLAGAKQPEEILAITFTKKAAAEMRHKVLGLLQEDTTQAKAIRARGDADGWQLFSNPNVLKIQTIDSFALEIASQTPFIKNATGVEITEQADIYYQQAATRLLAKLYQNNPSNLLLAEFLGFIDNDADKAVRLLSDMLSRRDQWLAPVTAVATNNDENLMVGLLAEAISSLRLNIETRLRAAFTPEDNNKLAALANVLGMADDWRPLFSVLLTENGTLRKRLTIKEGIHDSEHKRSFTQWLDSLRARELGTLMFSYTRCPELPSASDSGDGQLSILQLCCVALALAAAELDDILRAAGLLDFTGLLLHAKTALRDEHGPTDLALYLDYRIRHILVDEYQDTSRAQFEFFNLLTEAWQVDDGNTFFAVGDPMQSIYRFRDADVSIFADSRQHGLTNVSLTACSLQANFRSDPLVVRWCNGLFESLFGHSNATQLGEVSFSPASPMVPATADAAVHCLRFADSRDETQAVVRHVQALLAQGEDQDIAVLCRARTHLSKLLVAFSNLDIPVQATDMDLLASQPVIRDLMSLHGILLQPAHRLDWFVVLRSPLFGLSLTDLTRFADTTDFDTLITQQQLAHPHLKPQLQRLLSVLSWGRAHLYEVPLREVMEGMWFRCGATDAYAVSAWRHANAWFDLLDELKSKAYERSLLEGALRSLFAATNLKARVQIMTIHKAKGLEFDHVVVPYLDRRAQNDNPTLLLWRATKQGLLMGVRGDSVHEWLRYEERERARNEEKRLLYVACTRAKRTLFLSLSHDTDKKPAGLAKWLDHIAEPQPRSGAQFAPAEHQGNQGDLFVTQHLQRLPTDYQWQTPAYQGLVATDIEQGALNTDQISARYEVSLGLLVHRALAWCANSQSLSMQADQLLYRLERWALDMALDVTRHPDLIATCAEQIHQTLADPQGRWLLTAHVEARSEWPLTGVYQDVTTRIVLDRTFVDDDIRWIVDFKTGKPQPGDLLKSFVAGEVARYRPQMNKYREICASVYPQPINTALYFTALGHLQNID